VKRGLRFNADDVPRIVVVVVVVVVVRISQDLLST